MPSPFPGMNPYLEQTDVWPDFHNQMIAEIARRIAPQLGDEYIVKIEQELYVHELPFEGRSPLGIGDVGVATSGRGTDAGGVAMGLLDGAPLTAVVPMEQEITKHTWVAIRDKRGRDLVCVIEVLSPSNKRPGPDRTRYFAKRHELLNSPAHFVEINLLRGGASMPIEPLPVCDYYVMVSRAPERPQVGLWPMRLPDRLPEIPVPLREAAHVSVELQNALDTIYDSSSYPKYIYGSNPEPPLSPRDAAWAARFVSGV